MLHDVDRRLVTLWKLLTDAKKTAVYWGMPVIVTLMNDISDTNVVW